MRRFELSEGSSDKFWSIGVEDSTVAVHYGRIGTTGQRKEKAHASASAAQTDAEKQIAAKVKKGYAEVGSVTAPAPAAPADPEPELPASSAPDAPADEPPPPADLGFRWTALERAAIAGGPPLDLTIPEPFGTPEEIADHWEAWAEENTVLGGLSYWKIEYVTAPPFDGLPDRLTARWWAAYLCDALPTVHRNGRWEHLTYAEWWDEWPENVRIVPLALTKAQRRKLARAVVLDPDHPSPPRRLQAVMNQRIMAGPLVDVAIDLVLFGREQVLTDLTVPRTRGIVGREHLDYRWHILPALRALLPDLSADELDQIIPATQPEPVSSTVSVDASSLLRSALRDDPDTYAALLSRFDAPVDAGDVVGIASALPDETQRSELQESLDARRDQYDNGIDPFAVAVLGRPGLDEVTTVIGGLQSAAEAGAGTRRLGARLNGVGAVPTFLTLATHSKAAAAAREWLLAHVDAVAAYDGPLDKTQTGVLPGLVREILLSRPDVEFAHPVAHEAADSVRAEATLPVLSAVDVPDWWTEAAAAEEAAPVAESKLKLPTKLPDWVAALPPLVVRSGDTDVRLDDDLVAAVLLSAMKSGRDETLAPRSLVAAVRNRMSDAARDRFGIALLDGFLGKGAAAPERPLFLAAGFLGAGDFVATLTPLVRAWPGESQHQRAVMGLDVLAATGTEAALQSISSIANKSKFKGVQKAANESMERLAALRGLTADELQDRLIPDGGLDADGVRLLDFGPRQFRASLGWEGANAGKVIVYALDASGATEGKPRTALPAANSKDDPELAAAAKKDYAALKKAVTEVVKIQTIRLEQALVTGRSWTVADHATYLRDHPVMNGLIRGLVWIVQPDDSRPDDQQVLVRVGEVGEYLTADDEAYDPPANARIFLAHPLFLAEQEHDAWREQLADYGLTSPIDQLERATYALGDQIQSTAVELDDLPTGTINPGALLSTLERLGWRRGVPQDNGTIVDLSLAFPTQGVRVHVEVTGLQVGAIHDSPDQQVEGAWVMDIDSRHQGWYIRGRTEALPWHDIDPVVVSEVRRSLAALAEKME